MPSKDKKKDYDFFLSVMTEKLKNELSTLVRQRALR